MNRAVPRSVLQSAYSGKRVWVSGHTGFKGSWISTWLLELGAEVYGFSLAPPTKPALFEQLGLEGRLHHEFGDIRDAGAVVRSIRSARPDFVFHLAAQPIVRTSFAEPVETYATNVMGTIHVLEALRRQKQSCGAVLITTDKCYENREWLHGYREEDALGGYDPYSSSKACAEIAIASWRRSFFGQHAVRVASARAGNVIGGGDWAQARIVPDAIRSLQKNQPVPIRNQTSTRPWQHVLEPLSGYLWLAARLRSEPTAARETSPLDSAFNFGPDLPANRSVLELVTEIVKHWPGKWHDQHDPKAVHEAARLNLSTDKAFHILGWRPVWPFEKSVEATVAWYRKAAGLPKRSPAAQLVDFTLRQIADYQSDAAKAGLAWAVAEGGSEGPEL